MSKAVNEALGYSNEDVVEIHKHWIIFVKIAIKIIIESAVLIFIFVKWGAILEDLVRMIEIDVPSLTINPAIVPKLTVTIIVLVNAIVKLIATNIEYRTVGLKANNTYIQGQSGIASIGIISTSLDKIISISLSMSLLGRILHYGSIRISINGYMEFSMDYMVNTEQFQEAVLLLQDAQLEGRNIRQAERQGDIQRDIVREQTAAQTQAMATLGQNIGMGIAQSLNQGIVQNNTNELTPELEMKNESINV
ncbi:MAG: PH domain-containing protein [Lachnospiraceae bacterium]|nr:PH domain-containing protein [Lachnospiraceae bacterium]